MVVFSCSRYFYFYYYFFIWHLTSWTNWSGLGPLVWKLLDFYFAQRCAKKAFRRNFAWLLPIHCSILWQREYLLWPRHKPRHTWLSWLTFAPLRFGIASETLGQTRRHEKNIIPLACNICVLFFFPFPFCFVSFNLFFLSMYTVYFFVIYREITKFRLSAG